MMILLCSLLFIGQSPANAAAPTEDFYYKVVRTDGDTAARSGLSRQADEPQDRYHTATLQRRETEGEIKSRSRLLGKLPDEKPDERPDMSFCREAPYPSGTKGMIADRWRWCLQDEIKFGWYRCTIIGSCTKVGSLSFRMSVLATGKAGPAESDRSVEAWFILDQWDRDREILTDNTLEIEGECHRYGSGPRCERSFDVGKQKLSTWMNGNGYEWVKFTSPTTGLTGDMISEFPLDFVLTVKQNGANKEYSDTYEGPNVRCDSSNAGRRHGCGFADDKIPMIHRIVHSADNKEYAEHVKQAQSDPDKTMPTSAQTKSIPGSFTQCRNPDLSELAKMEIASHTTRTYIRHFAKATDGHCPATSTTSIHEWRPTARTTVTRQFIGLGSFHSVLSSRVLERNSTSPPQISDKKRYAYSGIDLLPARS
ncbi:hypothetical protein ACFXKK_23305 [Streptomyces globisporus]|uniref:hypothetical protein n=1 Tax=Streptomyces globisporus TaxID=1908 RepID=UPI0036512064